MGQIIFLLGVLGKMVKDSILLLLFEVIDLNFNLVLKIQLPPTVFSLLEKLRSFYRIFKEELLVVKIQVETVAFLVFVLLVDMLYFEHILQSVKRYDLYQNKFRIIRIFLLRLEHRRIGVHLQSLEPEYLFVVENLLPLENV
tara:strand:- start:635 stop:1060 length:426 start_codon:yes stop_codon:yes gene_type:complete